MISPERVLRTTSHSVVLWITLAVLVYCPRRAHSWTNCSDGNHATSSICPDLNTCCPVQTNSDDDKDDGVAFNCLTGTIHSNLTGDCCTDDDAVGTTGCTWFCNVSKLGNRCCCSSSQSGSETFLTCFSLCHTHTHTHLLQVDKGTFVPTTKSCIFRTVVWSLQ